jgi:hypothetical protein
MSNTDAKTGDTAHVRLFVPRHNHKRVTRLAHRIASNDLNSKAPIHKTYLRAIEAGLSQLEAEFV